MTVNSELFGLSSKNLSLIITALKSFAEIQHAIVFGSRAIGNYKPGSDIDLALKGDISLILLGRIKAKLEDEIATPYLFDIVVYNMLDPISNKELLEHIDNLGKELY